MFTKMEKWKVIQSVSISPFAGYGFQCRSVSAGGGKPRNDDPTMLADGPSPRVGGEHGEAVVAFRAGRTIPPGGGETSRLTVRMPLFSDHPPGWGGNFGSVSPPSVKLGPSPRVGGKPFKITLFIVSFRTIPPGGGETVHPPARAGPPTDHPPGWGGNKPFILPMESVSGPSPRVGGKRVEQGGHNVAGGTIPPGGGET